MDLSKYDGKHVRITGIYGDTFTGMARYGIYEFLMHEYGGDASYSHREGRPFSRWRSI